MQAHSWPSLGAVYISVLSPWWYRTHWTFGITLRMYCIWDNFEGHNQWYSCLTFLLEIISVEISLSLFIPIFIWKCRMEACSKNAHNGGMKSWNQKYFGLKRINFADISHTLKFIRTNGRNLSCSMCIGRYLSKWFTIYNLCLIFCHSSTLHCDVKFYE